MVVNAVSFGKRDSENNPTGGKWIGAGAGAAWGGYRVYKMNAMYNELDAFLATDAGKKIYDCKNIDSLKKFFTGSTLSAKVKKDFTKGIELAQMFGADKQTNFVDSYIAALKGPKKFKMIGLAIGAGFLTLIGLGVGAIVDHFRKHGEDD